MQYMTRCPFSLSRLVKVTADWAGHLQGGEGRLPGLSRSAATTGLAAGPKRNFQILSALEFLAEFTQHIPPKGAHLIRYYGWYSNKARGLRRKAAEADGTASRCEPAAPAQAGRCEPDLGHAHQAGVRDRPAGLSRVRRHDEGHRLHRAAAGRRDREDPAALRAVAGAESSPRGPPDHDATVCVPEADGPEWCEDCDCAVSAERTSGPGEPGELTFVDEDTFWATF